MQLHALGKQLERNLTAFFKDINRASYSRKFCTRSHKTGFTDMWTLPTTVVWFSQGHSETACRCYVGRQFVGGCLDEQRQNVYHRDKKLSAVYNLINAMQRKMLNRADIFEKALPLQKCCLCTLHTEMVHAVTKNYVKGEPAQELQSVRWDKTQKERTT